ncbi:MAG: ParA family protein [Anaerobutyricum soehngenii]
MLETVVRNRVSVNSANKARKPLARHRRFDAATKDYEDLTKEVLALME